MLFHISECSGAKTAGKTELTWHQYLHYQIETHDKYKQFHNFSIIYYSLRFDRRIKENWFGHTACKWGNNLWIFLLCLYYIYTVHIPVMYTLLFDILFNKEW